MIRISIVEDDDITQEVLKKLLRRASDVICVDVYASAEEAEQGISRQFPDVVLIDINLPERSGIKCVATLKPLYPQIEFMMLTTYDSNDLIYDALRAGAGGYLLKRAAFSELLPVIRQVHDGGSRMSLQIARRVVSHFRCIRDPKSDAEKLTDPEKQILLLLAKGLTYKQIADQLSINREAIHRYLHRIYEKLHIQTRTAAGLNYLN